MTSQIALLNSDGVAVASDSAVTLNSAGAVMNRTFSTSKIYQLSGRQPVGIMTSGAASYRSIPLSIIFGEFREWYANHKVFCNPEDSKIKPEPNRELDTLAEYADEIRKFLSTYPNKPTSELTTSKNLSGDEKLAFEYEIYKFLEKAIPSYKLFTDVSEVFNQQASTIDLYQKGTGGAVKRFLEEQMNDSIGTTILNKMKNDIEDIHCKMLENMSDEDLQAWPKEKARIARTYSCLVTPFIEKFVSGRLPKKLIRPLKSLVYNYLREEIPSNSRPTSIAIFGFGKLESQPSILTLKIGTWRSGIDTSIITDHKMISRSFDGPEQTRDDGIPRHPALICTFAQAAEMKTIITGIHPDLIYKVTSQLTYSLPDRLEPIFQSIPGLGNKTIQKIRDKIEDEQFNNGGPWDKIFDDIVLITKNERPYRHRKFHDSITLLPIQELANFAESLLEMESTIAYYSRRVRTVGGHTDVATITKEDGFLWVKSENRVDYSLNPRQDAAPRFSANLK